MIWQCGGFVLPVFMVLSTFASIVRYSNIIYYENRKESNKRVFKCAAELLGVEVAAIKAVLEVETGNKGIVWVKNGADKRKVFDNAELAEMMTAKCICFAGNSVGSKVFRDKVNDADMEGNLLHQYDTIMDFFTRNLHNVQVGDEFNSMGKLEIPYTSLVEFTVNSLVHRSLNMKAPVRIFIFDNRVEIHSPGALPNGLTIDDIKAGTSMPRNMFLFNNAIYLLPYTGVGSGITRALDEDINVTFMNNDKAQEFVITVWRGESNQVQDSDTRLRHSGTDLDTSENDLDTRLRHSGTDLDTSENDLDTQLRHSDTPKVSLSNKQRDIVNFCSVPRTTKEILDRIGVSMHSKNRERYITSLVAAGYLQMTNPENPTASNQKYKKVTTK